MRNAIALFAILGSVVACETQGVVDGSYQGLLGSHLSLRQFKDESRFYYSLSASMPWPGCRAREIRVVAMGADGHVRVRFEHSPASDACES